MEKKGFQIGSVGFIVGPILFLLTLAAPMGDLGLAAKTVLGLSLWMGAWWISEAIPIYVTGLLPVAIFPIFDILDFRDLSAFYADKIIFLFLGGFFLACAIETTNLHRRFALNILKGFGTSPRHIIGAFILITASLSAWMSNTATALLMIPIATAVLAAITIKEKEKLTTCLILSIAFSASIGGVATLIGTPPNAIFASLAKSAVGIDVSFGEWMFVGVPVSAVSLVALWFYMVYAGKIGKEKMLEGKEVVLEKLAELGKITSDEKRVLVVFVIAVAAWITRGPLWGSYVPMVDDSTISIIMGISLFAISSAKNGRVLEWRFAKIPWGVLFLIGGSLALAGGFMATGLDQWIASQLDFIVGIPFFAIVVILLLIVVFLEFLSNTASTALMLPIVASLSGIIGVNPIFLMLPVAIGASYGFILPAATPPNAIAVASGLVSPKKMAKFGLPLNLISVLIVAIMTFLLVPVLW